MKIIKAIKNIIKRIIALEEDRSLKTWQDIEYFNKDWEKRIQRMAQYIRSGSTVLDLGCGQMWTIKFLPKNCKYIPVDYVKRNEEVIVCDFNKYEFPDLKVDIAFVSGCLEYVNDYEWFVKKITDCSNIAIVSYCALEDFPDLEERKNHAWVNHLRKVDLIEIFRENGFSLEKEDKTDSNNTIFVFRTVNE
ncbi:MAG: methyltransferase domain-containing protein [Acidobacterium ailaaui]|nr:methyltransferase domain-containing protein [Pseudacidobacterium ailaaui]